MAQADSQHITIFLSYPRPLRPRGFRGFGAGRPRAARGSYRDPAVAGRRRGCGASARIRTGLARQARQALAGVVKRLWRSLTPALPISTHP